MSTISKQETFDTVVRALLAQGGPSMGPSLQRHLICRYRGEGGRKCAAGQLIPDDKYSADMENVVVNPVCLPSEVAARALLDALNGHDIELVQRLQLAHDAIVAVTGIPVSDRVWLNRFREHAAVVAYDYDLNTDVLK